MIKRLINNKVVLLSFAFFIFGIMQVFVRNVNLNNYYTFIAFFPLMLVSAFNIYNNKEIIMKNRALNGWLFFLLFVFVSEIQNGIILDAPILFAITGFIILIDIKLKDIVLSLVIGLTPLFFAALFGALIGNKFSSNSIGIIVSQYFIIVQIYMLILYSNNKAKEKKSVNLMLPFLLELVVLWVMVKINSRTALLISITSTILIILHFVYLKKTIIINYIRSSSKFMKIIYTILLLTGIIVFMYFSSKIVMNILTPKWRPNDISTGRFDIWKTTIEQRKLFGHPYNWYTESGLFGTHKGPHNILIGIIGFAGTIPLIIFLGVYLYTLFVSFRNYFKSPTSVNLVLLIMFITCSVKGITESLLLQSSFQIYNLFFILPVVYSIPSMRRINSQPLIYNDVVHSRYYKYIFLYFFAVMILNIYGSVFNYNMASLVHLLKRYF